MAGSTPELEAEGSYIQLQTHSKEREDWKGPDWIYEFSKVTQWQLSLSRLWLSFLTAPQGGLSVQIQKTMEDIFNLNEYRLLGLFSLKVRCHPGSVCVQISLLLTSYETQSRKKGYHFWVLHFSRLNFGEPFILFLYTIKLLFLDHN